MFNISPAVEGSNAFILGKARASNPYVQFSTNYLDWMQGWDTMKAKWIKEATKNLEKVK